MNYMCLGELGSESMGLKFEWGEFGHGPEFGIWFNSLQECNEDPKF